MHVSMCLCIYGPLFTYLLHHTQVMAKPRPLQKSFVCMSLEQMHIQLQSYLPAKATQSRHAFDP